MGERDPLDDIRGLLRGVYGDIPKKDTMAERRARVRLLSAVSEDPKRRTRSRVRPAAGAAVAVAIVVAWVFASASGDPTAAAATLQRLADTAGTRAPLPIPDGWYVYTRSEGTVMLAGHDLDTGATWRAIVPTTRKIWIAHDGSGRLIEITERPMFVSPRDMEAWEAAGAPSLTDAGVSRERFGPEGLFLTDPRDIATDPDTLIADIEERRVVPGPPGDASSLRIIASLLRDTFLTPDQRAAAFAAASRIGSVELVGDVTDHLGRVGVGIRASDHQGMVELIFDPVTSRLLEERVTETEGDVTTWTTFVEVRLTESTLAL